MSGSQNAVGVFTIDREVVVRSWDPWLAEATGIPAATACGRPLAELFASVEERGMISRLQRVAAEGVVEILAPAFHRYLIPCAPREPSPHFTQMQQHVTLSPLRTDDGVVGVVVTIEDVTARIDREQRLASELGSQDEAIRLRAAQRLAEEENEVGPTGALVGALADQSWRVRQAAARGLAHGRGEAAVAALLEALCNRHRDPAVLNAALSALIDSDQDVVTPLVELLRVPDAEVRTYAALALGQIGDARAGIPLVDVLGDADVNVRYHAVEALGRLRAREASEAIAAVAESGDAFLAFVALDALSAIGEASVVPRLVPLLDDAHLREPAAEAIGRLGTEESVAPLAACLGQAGTPTGVIAGAIAMLHDRLEALFGAGALVADLARSVITPEGGQSLVAAIPTAADGELPGLVRVLGWLDFPGVDRVLAHTLAHGRVRRMAADILAGRGAGAVDDLVAVLGAADAEPRRAAAMALGRIGSPAAVPGLVAMLGEASEVAIAAAGALGSIGDQQAFEALLALLDRPDAAVRQAAVSTLNSIAHPEMSSRIEALLVHPSPRVRESGARIAGYFGYPHCFERVLELTHDPDDSVRRAAVEHLPFFGSPRATGAILDALARDTPPVRAAAARAFGDVAGDEALPALLTACQDEDMWVRYHAARSLARHGAAGVVPALAELATADPAPPVRIAAAESLGTLGAVAGVSVLARLAEESDDAIACAALTALGGIGDPAALPPLIRGMASADAGRQMAALAGVGGRHAAAVPAVVQLARDGSDQRVRERAVHVLGAIGSEQAAAALIELAAEPHLRGCIVSTLARVGEEQVEWVGRGLAHPDAGVRCRVVESLAHMKHPSAGHQLAVALGDSAEPVRRAAASGLRRRDLHAGGTAPRGLVQTSDGTVVRLGTPPTREMNRVG